MYIICIESSKTRGMGHFFRSLLYVSYLQKNGKKFILLINNDSKAIDILKDKKIPYVIVDFSDDTDWQTPIIKQYGAKVWLQDKFETAIPMAENIAHNDILFCMIDEFGPGAELCDLHFAGMIYLTGREIYGKKRFCGSEFVILNPEIECYKMLRKRVSKVVISLGGSDPFGTTVEVVKKINETNYDVEIIIGPDFVQRKELEEVNINHYPIFQNVPSLIKEFSGFDFAVTGGGITCCEANASGIPCLIIANAPHEIQTGHYMENKGGAVFAGSYMDWNRELVNKIPTLDIEFMSRSGMATFDTKAIERIFTVIEQEL